MKYTVPIIAILCGYIIFLHSCHLPDVKQSVETTERTYESVVDSLGKEITYWKNVEPEVVRDTVEVPVPKLVYVNGDTLNEYTSAYTDSVITARWTQQIAGTLENQTFEYYLKRKQVTQQTKYKIRTITTEREVRITNTIQPKGYISVGGFAGHANNEWLYGPSVSYTDNNQSTYFINYNVNTGGVIGGVRVKLKLFNF